MRYCRRRHKDSNYNKYYFKFLDPEPKCRHFKNYKKNSIKLHGVTTNPDNHENLEIWRRLRSGKAGWTEQVASEY